MITITLYKTIADLIDSAQRRGEDVVSYIDKMATDMALSEIPSTDVNRLELDNQIELTSNILDAWDKKYSGQMKNFVFALQKYVDDDYPLVNNFLRDNNEKVKTVFADISNTVGYPIDSDNIESDDPSG
jgi:hypothetical protein